MLYDHANTGLVLVRQLTSKVEKDQFQKEIAGFKPVSRTLTRKIELSAFYDLCHPGPVSKNRILFYFVFRNSLCLELTWTVLTRAWRAVTCQNWYENQNKYVQWTAEYRKFDYPITPKSERNEVSISDRLRVSHFIIYNIFDPNS